MKTKTANERVPVAGNTYPVKEELKALGARWDAGEKAWMVPAEKAAEAQRIVAAAGPKKPYSGAKIYGARTYGDAQVWAQRHNDGIGFCGARGCGRNGCEDCNPM